MRKLLVLALLVFSTAFVVGLTTNKAEAAKCWYQCGCNGEALYCCRYGPAVLCKIVFNAPIECPQVAC